MITRRKHRQEIIALGQAYRWENEDERVALAARRKELDTIFDRLASATAHRDLDAGGSAKLQVVLDASDLLVGYGQPVGDEFERLAARIASSLHGLRDYRPDMRAPDRLPL